MTGPALVGLDIGATKVLGVVLDGSGDVVASTRLVTGRGAAAVVGSAASAVRRLAEQVGVGVDGLASLGVGVPGLVLPRSGQVAHAVNLGLAEGPVDLGAALSQRLGLPVAVENDVNAAALGSARLLGLADRDLALLSIGTGLAAGFVSRGLLRRGAHGAAGEIGHVPVDPAGPWCPCGQRGCLERLASGAALAEVWPVPPGTESARSLFAAVAAGDGAALRVRDAYCGHVASAVRLLALTWDVDAVVLGGGVTDVGRPLLDGVRAALEQQAQGSPLLASLHLAARVAMVPPGSTVAAVGAALAGAALVGGSPSSAAGAPPWPDAADGVAVALPG